MKGCYMGPNLPQKFNQNKGTLTSDLKIVNINVRDFDISWSTILVLLIRLFIIISYESEWYHMAGE
jgi:hypothetical protein